MTLYKVPFDGASGSVWVWAGDPEDARDKAAAGLQGELTGGNSEQIIVDVSSIGHPEEY